VDPTGSSVAKQEPDSHGLLPFTTGKFQEPGVNPCDFDDMSCLRDWEFALISVFKKTRRQKKKREIIYMVYCGKSENHLSLQFVGATIIV